MLLLLWAIFIAGGLISEGRASQRVVDNDHSRGIDVIATNLCKDNSWHTKRIHYRTTIYRLIDYFGSSSSSSNHKLSACRERYLEPLSKLRAVVEASDQNICSKRQLELIDKFHWEYVASTLIKTWFKAPKKKLPEPLRVFFMQYANDIAEICKETLAHRLKQVTERRNVQIESLLSSKRISSIANLNLAMVMQDSIKNFDSFFFLWNQIINKERKKGYKLLEDFDNLTNELVVALIKVKSPDYVWSLQRKCRLELRPIYQETTLPVMRLFELGYGRVDDKSASIMRGSASVRNWYAATQLCELIIPINFYKDESLEPGEAVILSDFSEARGLKRPVDVVPVDEIPHIDDVEHVYFVDYPEPKPNDQVVKQVKLSLKTRSRLYRHFFKNIMSNLRGKLKSKLKKIFVMRKTKDNKLLTERGNDILRQSTTEIDKLIEEDNDDTEPKVPLKIKRLSSRRTAVGRAEHAMRMVDIVLLVIEVLLILALIFSLIFLFG